MSFFLNSYFINLTASSIPIIYYDLIYDQYWDNTVLLLHGDKSIVDNQVIDKSLRALPITRFGETPKNVLSPFGILGESIDFRQTSNYLTVSGGDWFNFGSSNFTIECWFYATTNSGGYGGIFVKSSVDLGRYTFNMSPLGNTAQFWINKWGVSGPICGSSTVITDGVWHHLAAVRNNNVFTFYVDGVAGSVTNTWTGSIDDSLVDPYIGVDPFSLARELNALISNFRITKGVALYTSNFTPPISSLTLTSNGGATPSTLPTSNQISLLLLNDISPPQNNTFLDSSTNNFTITRNGTPTQGSFSPFALSAAPYYPSVNLGSGYFNGTTDHLTLLDSEQFNLASNNFTIECWVNFNSNVNQYYFGQLQSASADRSFCHAIIGGKYYFEVRSGSTAYSITSIENITMNVWTHMAAVRNGNTITLYKDGTSIGTVSVAGVTVNNSSLSVGLGGAGAYNVEPLNGYISNARLVNGTAIYTTNFFVPTSPVTTTSNGGATPSTLPSPSQVSLLCNFANAGIYDSTEKNNLITIGNASLSSSQIKYGSGAMYFNNNISQSYLQLPRSTDLAFGIGDFTMECWVYFIQFSSIGRISMIYASQGSNDTNGASVYFGTSTSNKAFVGTFNGGGRPTLTHPTTLSLNRWYHIATVKNNNQLNIYVDGIGTTPLTTTFSFSANTPTIGSNPSAPNLEFLKEAYIDDFRITKGIARYTSNFTPPSRAFPDIPYLGVFALQIDTTRTGSTNSNQFNLALRSSTSYDFDIDWGDNVTETYTSLNTTGYNHTYPAAGIYTVTIAERSLGGFPGVFYNNVGDKLKLLNINQFGGNQFGTNWSNAFNGCTNLQISASDFTTTKTQNITDFSAAWSSCLNLRTFPAINTSNATNFFQTWYNCQGLPDFPLINTQNVTNFSQAWAVCSSLTSFPLLNTSKGTNFSNAWFLCNKLTSFPAINILSAINLNSAWFNCSNLTSFPNISTSNVTDFNLAWSGCTSLTAFPLIDTSKGLTFNSAWYNCNKLISFPNINTLSATNFSNAWQFCTSLSSFPLINTDSANTFSGTWYGCSKLQTFPPLDFSKAKGTNNFSGTWNGCTSLTSFPTISAERSILRTWMNCTSLTGFREGSYLKPIGNFGAAFQNCFALITLPTMDTLSATDFGFNSSNLGPWNNCRSLTSFPLIDTRNGTTFYGAWQNCYSLSASEFPTLNMSKMTIGTNCFAGVKLTTTSYSALLTSLCATNFNTAVTFHGGNSTFNTAGSAAKVFLTTSTGAGGRGWTITDGGYQAGT
jgi:hypothetical protein